MRIARCCPSAPPDQAFLKHPAPPEMAAPFLAWSLRRGGHRQPGFHQQSPALPQGWRARSRRGPRRRAARWQGRGPSPSADPAGPGDPEVRLEDLLQELRRDAGTAVRHRSRMSSPERPASTSIREPAGSVADRVAQEVLDGAAEQFGIADHQQVLAGADLELAVPGPGLDLLVAAQFGDQRRRAGPAAGQWCRRHRAASTAAGHR